MDRRQMIKATAALSVGAFAAPALGGPCDPVHFYGALTPGRTIKGRRFYQEFAPLRGLGRHLAKEGKNVFLWKNLEKEIGEIEPHYQGPTEDGIPGEGDCVGHATAMGCDVLAATDIHLRNEPERFFAKASVEAIYWGSRVEIGQQDDPALSILGRPGSHGFWAADWVRKYGVLHRTVYHSATDQLDLTGYHPGRSRSRRDTGVPDWLEPVAKAHPVKITTNVETGMEGVDAICAGNPVLTCSSYAFRPERDERGFCKAYGEQTVRRGWRGFSRFRIQWWHALVATGVVFYEDGIGVLIQNSHGDWNGGPRPFDIPRGSFFVDFPTWDAMVRDWGDCHALGSYYGHQIRQYRNRLHKLWR